MLRHVLNSAQVLDGSRQDCLHVVITNILHALRLGEHRIILHNVLKALIFNRYALSKLLVARSYGLLEVAAAATSFETD